MDTFLETSEKFSDGSALISLDTQVASFTYGQLRQVVKNVASRLLQLSISRGDRVALCGENSPYWGACFLGILQAGATVVPFDMNLPSNEVAFILKDSGSHIWILSDTAKMKQGENCLLFHGHLLSMKDAVNEMAPQIDSFPAYANFASILYTSGTTGVAKGVTITGTAYGANIYGARERFKITNEDKFLSVLPLYHSYEGTCGFLLPICLGASVTYARSLKPNELIEDLQYTQPTVMLVVPLLMEKFRNSIFKKAKEAGVVKHTLFQLFYRISKRSATAPNKGLGRILFRSLRERIGFQNVRYLVSGGSALPRFVEEDMQALGIPLVQGYGLTECAPLVSANNIYQYRRGSVGLPFEFCEVKVAKDNEGQDGILHVRGVHVTKEYWNNPDATRQAFTDDGWFITGDVVSLDDNGFLSIVGRRKDVIVTSAGKNVYPETLEQEVLKDSRISECVVFGKQNQQKTGYQIAIVVVFDVDWMSQEFPNNPSDETLRQIAVSIVAAVNEKQPDYRKITNIEVSRNELEKTTTRKIKRYKYQSST